MSRVVGSGALMVNQIKEILAAVDTEIAAIKAITDVLPDSGAFTTLIAAIATLDGIADDIKAVVDTEIATIDTVVDAIKAITDVLPDSGAFTTLIAAIATIDSEVGTVDGVVDAIKSTVDTNLDGKVSEAKADLTALETAVGAIPTTAMRGTDNVPTTPQRGTDGAALASAYTAARALSLEKLGRSFEAYTPQVSVVAENDNTYVTVQTITGRGILVSVGATGMNDNLAAQTQLKLTIDGSIVVNEVTMLTIVVGSSNDFSTLMMIGFETSCLVEMKQNVADVTGGNYNAVSLVE